MKNNKQNNLISKIKLFFSTNGWDPLPYQIKSWEAFLNGGAYSGLTNIEIKELDKWIRKNTIEKFGPVRSLKPEMVFEISFEKIQISKRHKSGIAVRFPRITKWRKDKKINDADSLENAYELMKKIS